MPKNIGYKGKSVSTGRGVVSESGRSARDPETIRKEREVRKGVPNHVSA